MHKGFLHILTFYLIKTIITGVSWYIIVVLIYIFLIISDVECILIYLFAICMSLEKYLFNSSAHFYSFFFFFIMSPMSSLYILDINDLSNIKLTHVFHQFIGYLFILLVVLFCFVLCFYMQKSVVGCSPTCLFLFLLLVFLLLNF